MFVIKGGFCKTCVSLIKAEMKITSEKTTKMIFEKDRLNSGSKKNPHVFIWSANYKEGSIYKPEKFSGMVCRGILNISPHCTYPQS